jgi:hypothetical protein
MGIDLRRRDFAVVLKHLSSTGSDCSAQVVAVAKSPGLVQMFSDVRHGVSMSSLELTSDIMDLRIVTQRTHLTETR